jgi:hypothetical protein
MIVGIAGLIGSGKDTLGNFICQCSQNKFKNAKFATSLREVVQLFTNITVEESETAEGKDKFLPEWQMTVGQMMQRLATDAIRNNLHPDAWIITFFNSVNKDDNIVITDVRFPNEIMEICKRGGIIIRILSRNNTTDSRDKNHISETLLDDQYWEKNPPDTTVYNYYTLKELEQNAKIICSNFNL